MRRGTRSNPVDDSDVDSGSETPDSDTIADNSNTRQKKTVKRKGRTPPSRKQKAQRLQDDSDDAMDTSPQPGPSQTAQQSSDEAMDNDSSDSDYVSGTPQATQPLPKRGRGRPPAVQNNKTQVLQNGSNRADSPQPSTSQAVEESGNDSSSADSDYGPLQDRNQVKKKPPHPSHPPKRQPLPRKASSKKLNNAVNGTGRHSQPAEFDPALVESLAQKLVYFLLIEDQKKYAIRRKAITAHVFKDEDYSPKLYTAVINKANVILKKTFGMELMELENQKDSYLIVNILRRELDVNDYVEMSRTKQQQQGLILYILTVIYMNENVLSEDELTRSLRPLGIDLTSKRNHPVFGDVNAYIKKELVKQMYVNYECVRKEPPKYEFSWGLRAIQEFDKKDLLQFVCQIMDDTSPEEWRIQFRDAEASARQEDNS